MTRRVLFENAYFLACDEKVFALRLLYDYWRNIVITLRNLRAFWAGNLTVIYFFMNPVK